MYTMKTGLPLILLGLLASACTGPSVANAGMPGLEIRKTDSSILLIERTWFETGPDRQDLWLAGLVRRRLEAPSSRHSHLDLSLRDGHGRILWSATTGFQPDDIPAGPKPSHRQASYRQHLGTLPPGAATLEVTAHDAPHSPG